MMKEPFGGLILNVAFRMLVPFTIVYGVYVLCLGEFSPGGGFQAGALLAVGVLLARLILGFDTKFNVLGKTSVVLAGLTTVLVLTSNPVGRRPEEEPEDPEEGEIIK